LRSSAALGAEHHAPGSACESGVSASIILVVDDEEPHRTRLAALLHADGYLTLSAANAVEAQASIADQMPDLILLDVAMPDMGGLELAALLKADAATSSIPIIMLTAEGDRSTSAVALDAGADEFLTKPFEAAAVRLRVRNLLRLRAFGAYLQDHAAILETQVVARTADLNRFRVAMDATADAILLVSRASMRFVEVNATACAMLGYTRAEMLQIGAAQLGAATPAALAQVYDALIAAGLPEQLNEVRLKRKDGSRVLVEMHRHAQRSGEDWIIVGVVRDITGRKAAEDRLMRLVHYDTLTGLPNRTLFYKNLARTIASARERRWSVAVLCVDLDHFKHVYEMRGHSRGDELLRQIGNRLVECVRIRDSVARIGADEFGITLTARDGMPRAHVVADRIRETLRLPFDPRITDRTVTASIGISVFPNDAPDAETVVKYADTAMHQAKRGGHDTIRFFSPRMNSEALARLELETALRKAVDNGEFTLHYQPKMHIESGTICGLEALLRWERPGHGTVGPNDFISVLEDTGLIVAVGRWVIAAACAQITEWLASSIGPVAISVNVAGRQFIDGDLEADVTDALRAHGVEPHLLELELTESSLMANTESTVNLLTNLRNLGIGISIDDFGTGYSSLAYLRRFPVDKLKIDRAFIRGITTNADDAAIALAIIRMAHTLKLGVVAEGVETQAQLDFLRMHGCAEIQGFYLSRPLPVQQIEDMLLEFNHRLTADAPL
jgi:diguanylate cyclase (GGDEF)-like protein/PAS domain S-box-containing protein